MKLGSLKEGGRDGTLIVVSRDLSRAVKATGIAAERRATVAGEPDRGVRVGIGRWRRRRRRGGRRRRLRPDVGRRVAGGFAGAGVVAVVRRPGGRTGGEHEGDRRGEREEADGHGGSGVKWGTSPRQHAV